MSVSDATAAVGRRGVDVSEQARELLRIAQ